MRVLLPNLFGILVLLGVSALADAAQRRGLPVVGEVASAKGDEQILLQGEDAWAALEIGQPLVNGDRLRTGPYGALGIVFRDGTQIRLQQNSELRIEYLRKGPEGDEGALTLLKGSLWSRVAREFLPKVKPAKAQPRVQLQTPVATIGIRGTDWHVRADENETTLTVMSGEAELRNDRGAVAVRRGEVGSARPGQAPSKRVLVDLRERPLISMDIEVEWLDMLAPAANTRGAHARGLALLRQRKYSEALRVLGRSGNELTGVDRERALTATAAAHIGLEDYARAEALLTGQIERMPRLAEPRLLEIWLTSFRGEHEQAIALAQGARQEFPKDSRFAALLAHLHFVTDQPAQMLAAANAATALEPKEPFGWHVTGLYHQYAAPNAALAKAAYLRALRARRSYSPSWNNLALLHVDLAEYRHAELAFQEAMAADPQSARIRANYGFLLAILNRMDEAGQVFREALKREPDAPYGLLGLGYLDMYQGRPDAGIEDMIKATTVYPELPGGSTSLAAAYYQAGRYHHAQQELENARRLDPDDPVPDVMGSVMAVDHYRAAEAIELAREGFDKTLRAESFAVDNLANSKTGSATLGNAFSNLGLDAWGGFYTELAFDPYLAGGYFYLSQREQFESERARLGANRQGLLLDPLAASAPTRYYEPFRQPRTDLSLFGQVGDEDGAFFHSERAILQGFTRRPNMLAWFTQVQNDDDEGRRDNSASDHQLLFGQLGTSWDNRQHNLFLELDAQSFDTEQPGSTFDPDFNDRDENRFAFIGLGYQHRLDFNNRVLARVVAGVERRDFRTNDEQLLRLGNRDFSLLNAVAFDLQTVRDLYLLGLYEVTPNYGGSLPNDPDFAVGATGAGFGGPALLDAIPIGTDVDQTLDNDFRSENLALQARHMLDVGPAEVSYGAEYYPIREEQKISAAVLRQLGVACLAFAPPDPGPACPAAGGFPFAFGAPGLAETRFDNDTNAYLAYAQARWKITPAFWAEGGLFYRRLDVDFESAAVNDIDESELNPRLGFGWRVNARHWLRAAYQEELLFPLRAADSLAPVATMGLVVPETQITFFEGGPRVADLQLRWDGEWLPWLFTFVNLERQTIRDFQVSFVNYEKGEIEAATLGANLWLWRDFGLALSHAWTDSADRSGGVFHGNEIVTVAEEVSQLALTWVHPRQFRTVLAAEYSGERFNDTSNATTLDSYWLVNGLVEWEPGRKHWLLQLGVNNLLDEDFEIARGFPGPRRFVFLAAEYRL